MTDRQKIELWEEICVTKGLASEGEFNLWLDEAEVFFTPAGSSIPTDVYRLTRTSLDKILPESDYEQLATFVLEALSGVLQFQDSETYKYFWMAVKALLRLNNVTIPVDLPPFEEHIDDDKGQDSTV